jgi:hypothetical protein
LGIRKKTPDTVGPKRRARRRGDLRWEEEPLAWQSLWPAEAGCLLSVIEHANHKLSPQRAHLGVTFVGWMDAVV